MEDIKFTLKESKDIKNVYCLHLINNNLTNDSKSLTINQMYDYCVNHIDNEDREWYGMPKIKSRVGAVGSSADS